MTELELLLDFHKDAERQGPGCERMTKKALEFIDIRKNENLRIADIGCGSGAQTFVLAQNTPAMITAVDIFPEFLDKLNKRAKQQNLDHRIETIQRSMDELKFEEEEFDIIWSEGAIYITGFENGITMWRKFIKPKGFIALSEITYTTNSRPEELEIFWKQSYPEIDTASNKIKILETQGYSLVAFFILPEYCWINNYYNPIKERLDKFINKHGNKKEIIDFVENEKKEIEIYEKYKDFYSYGFYIAQKNYI